MGGIDAFDSFISLYRTKIKSTTKYYLKIYFHMMDLFLVNSWLLYRRDYFDIADHPKGSYPMPLWDFKAEVGETLCKRYVLVKRPRSSRLSEELRAKTKRGPTATIPVESVRRDGADHLPKKSATRGRCKRGCGYAPKTYCVKCNVNLCILDRDCFYDFHVY